MVAELIPPSLEPGAPGWPFCHRHSCGEQRGPCADALPPCRPCRTRPGRGASAAPFPLRHGCPRRERPHGGGGGGDNT